MKRSRPLLGTFFQIQVREASRDSDQAVNLAFQEAARLETIFSLFEASSELQAFNRSPAGQWLSISAELFEVVCLAHEIWQRSEGAFNPFFPERPALDEAPLLFRAFSIYKVRPTALDLNGIAKGYIVDKAVEKLRGHHSSLSGFVNGGGDLRFFGNEPRRVELRMRTSVRRLEIAQPSIASSAPAYSQDNPESSTRYSKDFAKSENHSVSVVAGSCMVADALTKVALYGDKKRIQNCASWYGAQTLIFDARGELEECL